MLVSGLRSLTIRNGGRFPASSSAGLRNLRTLSTAASRPPVPILKSAPAAQFHPPAHLRTSPLLPALPRPQISIVRPCIVAFYATSGKDGNGKSPRIKDMIPDQAAEEKARQQIIPESHPSEVTSKSSTRPIFEPKDTGLEDPDDAPSTTKALKGDLSMVKDTFAMQHVPKDLMFMGCLGLVPYVVTSATTLFLSWDINYGREHGLPYAFSNETAQAWLNALEPIQIGYGAVLLSFLGAIHWGLEFSRFGGVHGYKRYAIGILAPLLAWPTVHLPLDYALLTQFVGFTGMYFADVIATKWGWAPTWYMNYRFALTFVVGACIVLTLIARSQIGDQTVSTGNLKSNQYIESLRKIQAEEEAKEQEAIREKKRKEQEEKKRKEEGKDSDNDEKDNKPKAEGKEGKAFGALAQRERSLNPKTATAESSENRRMRDMAETEEEKETGRGPKRTSKTVDPENVHGKPDAVAHSKMSESQDQQMKGKSQKETLEEGKKE